MTEPAPEKTSSSLPPADSLAEAPVPLRLRLLNFARRVPWWAVIIVAGISFAAYDMYTDDERREILAWLADNPEWITDDLFEVVYEVNSEAVVINESLIVADLQGNRNTIAREFVVDIEERSVLTCEANAPPGCLDQRGDVATYYSFNVPERRIPDGEVEFEGVLTTQIGSTLRLTLPDGSAAVILPDSVITREEGVLSCNRLAIPDCEPLSGEIITFRRPYILQRGLLARADMQIRFLSDGYITTIRPSVVHGEREEIIACPPGIENCEEVTARIVIVPEKVVGVEVDNDDESVLVRTVNRETVTIPRSRVQEIEPATVTCDREKDPRCQDYEGVMVSIIGETFTGELTAETAVQYKIIPPGRTRSLEFDRREIDTEVRVPENCVYQDPQCQITIKLQDSVVSGRLIEDKPERVVIETVPEKIVRIDRDQINEDRSTRVPGTCALNNPRGCSQGIWLTLLVTVTAYGMALFIGLIFGIMRVSSNIVLYQFSTLYVELVRGIPLLVILFFFAYGLSPQLRQSESVFGDIFRSVYDSITQLQVDILGREYQFLAEAIIGLSIGYGAFLAEIFRAGIQSIGRGQMEAARSSGMSYPQAMRFVILPQAVRVVLPPLGNDFIALLKDSALIAALALPDLLQQGRIYQSRTFQPLPAYIGVVIFYVTMTLLLSQLVRFIERRARLP